MNLPAGHTVRPMRQEDAAVIAERSGAYTSALLGFPKHSPEDVANYLRDPGIDPATDVTYAFLSSGLMEDSYSIERHMRLSDLVHAATL